MKPALADLQGQEGSLGTPPPASCLADATALDAAIPFPGSWLLLKMYLLIN